MTLPDDFTSAVHETRQLSESGDLTADLFDDLVTKARTAIEDRPGLRSLMGSLMKFAPDDWREAHEAPNGEVVDDATI